MQSHLKKLIPLVFIGSIAFNSYGMEGNSKGEKAAGQGTSSGQSINPAAGVFEQKEEQTNTTIALPAAVKNLPLAKIFGKDQQNTDSDQGSSSNQLEKTSKVELPQSGNPQFEEDPSNLFEEITYMEPAEVEMLIASAPQEIRNALNITKLIRHGIIKKPTIYFFVGKPGVGKTELAKAIAMQLQLAAWLINCPGLQTYYASHATKRIKEIFKRFKELNEPHVLIFDEINQLMNKTDDKQDESRRSEISACFWGCLDSNSHNPNLILIATANDIDQLPDQLKSRIHSNIYEILPNYDVDVIKKLIKTHLGTYNGLSDKELDDWAKQASIKKISAREITNVIHHALRVAQCRDLQDYTFKKEDEKELEEKIKTIKVTNEDIKEQFARLLANRRLTQFDKPFRKKLWDNLGTLAKTEQYRGFILPLSQIGIHAGLQIAIQMWGHRFNSKLHAQSIAIAIAGLGIQKLGFMQSRLQHIMQAYKGRYSGDFLQGLSTIIANTTSSNNEKKRLNEYMNAIELHIDESQQKVFNQQVFKENPNDPTDSISNPIDQKVHRSPWGWAMSWFWRSK